jgi:hypothetical protein
MAEVETAKRSVDTSTQKYRPRLTARSNRACLLKGGTKDIIIARIRRSVVGFGPPDTGSRVIPTEDLTFSERTRLPL